MLLLNVGYGVVEILGLFPGSQALKVDTLDFSARQR